MLQRGDAAAQAAGGPVLVEILTARAADPRRLADHSLPITLAMLV